jgi:cell division protein FtsL
MEFITVMIWYEVAKSQNNEVAKKKRKKFALREKLLDFLLPSAFLGTLI